MKRFFKSPLLWVVIAGAGLLYFFLSKKGILTGSGSVIDPLNIKRYPPPGYSGPVNGPFQWAGIGNPPDGVWETIGQTNHP